MSGNRELFFVLGVLSLCASGLGCGQGDLIPLNVQLGSRSVSKFPFVIAQDQGLYEKYGLDVELRMPPPDFEGGRATRPGLLTRIVNRIRRRTWEPHIIVDGATPQMVRMATNARIPRQIFLAATDCVVRAHIIARKGIESVEDLKGKRLVHVGASL